MSQSAVRWVYLASGFVIGCQASAPSGGEQSDRFVGAQPSPGMPSASTAGSSAPLDPNAPAPSDVAGAPSAIAGNGGITDEPEPMHVVPPTPPEPEPCDVAGCPPNLMCESSGVCVTPPPACLGDDDCASTQRCGLTGACLDPGGCRVRDDCGMGQACRMEQCVTGSDCGQTELMIDPIEPNVMVVFDISTSMLDGLDGCVAIPFILPCMPSKMDVASQATAQMTVSYRDEIRWGLAMFPGDGRCGAPASAIAPAPGNADMVSSTIANTAPAGTTPINAAIAYVQGATGLFDPARRNYVLLLTDGAESCNGDNANTASRIGEMQAMGIGTFVVGFGGGVDAAALNSFAVAGGVPNTSGGSSYYQADSAGQLQTALDAILGQVVGCDFALAAPPTDPAMVWAFFDDVIVERDTPDGWTLDLATNTLTFAGSACAQLQGGSVADIDIVFGCPEPVLE